MKTLSKAKVLRSVRAPAPLMTRLLLLRRRRHHGKRVPLELALAHGAKADHHLDVGLLRHRGGRLGRSVREGVVLGSRRSRVVRVSSRRRSPSKCYFPRDRFRDEPFRHSLATRRKKTAAGHDVVRVSAGRKIDQATIPTARTVREKRKSPSNQSAPNGRFAKKSRFSSLRSFISRRSAHPLGTAAGRRRRDAEPTRTPSTTRIRRANEVCR